ncbi:uncharacterized protein Bfra_001021 [Botrytis fragariae]|uniref:Uncharacterized protein n=1 Tax=Botrytis fragariae TaxID=1964551 RepID=A0A8H6ENX2_9HELO|nr:uncharacterized protein Bfra_001021 [Botrytis fragariae]KAF5878850.1 hypothetical protein Bfra_001021 [Botrytis fragariae]
MTLEVLGSRPSFPLYALAYYLPPWKRLHAGALSHDFGSLGVKLKKSTMRFHAGVGRGKIPNSRLGSRISSSASDSNTV